MSLKLRLNSRHRWRESLLGVPSYQIRRRVLSIPALAGTTMRNCSGDTVFPLKCKAEWLLMVRRIGRELEDAQCMHVIVETQNVHSNDVMGLALQEYNYLAHRLIRHIYNRKSNSINSFTSLTPHVIDNILISLTKELWLEHWLNPVATTSVSRSAVLLAIAEEKPGISKLSFSAE